MRKQSFGDVFFGSLEIGEDDTRRDCETEHFDDSESGAEFCEAGHEMAIGMQ